MGISYCLILSESPSFPFGDPKGFPVNPGGNPSVTSTGGRGLLPRVPPPHVSSSDPFQQQTERKEEAGGWAPVCLPLASQGEAEDPAQGTRTGHSTQTFPVPADSCPSSSQVPHFQGMDLASQTWPVNMSAANRTETLALMSQHSPPSSDEIPLYSDYKPPVFDLLPIPKAVLYMLMAAAVVVSVAYAIVGHLIKDLAHDLADCLLGPQPEEPDKEEPEHPPISGFQPSLLAKTRTCTCSTHHTEEVHITLEEVSQTT